MFDSTKMQTSLTSKSYYKGKKVKSNIKMRTKLPQTFQIGMLKKAKEKA